MQLFYDPDLEDTTRTFTFPAQESKHLVRVLRKGPGDRIHITNGRGDLFQAEILRADPGNCSAQIVSHTKSLPKGFRLHLAVAPTKMNDRYEWMLEKATEIGLDEISPIVCQHSERRTIKADRMEKVLQAAMKQSQQTHLPRLHPLCSFQEFLERDFPGLKFIAHCQAGDREELKRVARADTDITVLIGPEGDFSPEEVDLARAKGFVPISLGHNRLRTETAAILACATINTINY